MEDTLQTFFLSYCNSPIHLPLIDMPKPSQQTHMSVFLRISRVTRLAFLGQDAESHAKEITTML